MYAQTRVRTTPVKPIAIGDVVRVKGSAISMTVNLVHGVDVECLWFVDATLHREWLAREALERVS